MKLFKFAGLLIFLSSGILSVAAQVDVYAAREIQGGILNGKAVNMPKPEYPEDLKLAGIQGTVKIKVTIDEEGNVISAEPVDNSQIVIKRVRIADSAKIAEPGDVENYEISKPEPTNPILIESARQAALNAKFSPTMLSGSPVKVRGFIVYNFSAARPVAQTDEKTISGGVLNGKAQSLPAPIYPAAAKAVRAGGSVTVQVFVDENGDVTAANAVFGHPLLRNAATEAAMAAKFAPTLLQGNPVKIVGVLTYNFVP